MITLELLAVSSYDYYVGIDPPFPFVPKRVRQPLLTSETGTHGLAIDSLVIVDLNDSALQVACIDISQSFHLIITIDRLSDP